MNNNNPMGPAQRRLHKYDDLIKHFGKENPTFHERTAKTAELWKIYKDNELDLNDINVPHDRRLQFAYHLRQKYGMFDVLISVAKLRFSDPETLLEIKLRYLK